MSEYIELQQVVVDAVVVKVRGDRVVHIVRGMLDRREGADLLPVRQDDDAAGMLSRRTSHLCTALGQTLDLRAAHMHRMLRC